MAAVLLAENQQPNRSPVPFLSCVDRDWRLGPAEREASWGLVPVILGCRGERLVHLPFGQRSARAAEACADYRSGEGNPEMKSNAHITDQSALSRSPTQERPGLCRVIWAVDGNKRNEIC